MRGLSFTGPERETFDWFVGELEKLAHAAPKGLGATVKRHGRHFVDLSTRLRFDIEAQPDYITIGFEGWDIETAVDASDRKPFNSALALFDAICRGRVREVTLLKPSSTMHVARLNAFGEKAFIWVGTDLFGPFRRKPIRNVRVRRDPELQAALNA